jgi:uncharacterized membrane protein
MSSGSVRPELSRRRGVVLVAGWLVGIVAYQLVIHRLLADGQHAGLARVLVLAPLALALASIALTVRSPRVRLLAVLSGLGLVAAMLWGARSAAAPLLAIHMGAYVALAALFGATLLPGREALATRIARAVHGTLPPALERYSRTVTWVWTAFFLTMAGLSAGLYWLASLATWSFFVNVLNLPLLVLMFVCEYAYRVRTYPQFRHAAFLTGILAFRAVAAQSQRVRKAR